jgi:hypothetical protein
MAAKADYRGEVGSGAIRTPVSILREQAGLLGPKTHNLIEAKVETEAGEGDGFMHSFYLVVPALDNYRYRLFKIYHPIGLYPVQVAGQDVRLQTEETFNEWLRERLSSEQTKRIVANLLAQVSA